MKKILTVLFSLLFVSSVYGLDFDSNTDTCLRTILDKHEGEITTTDLRTINEFYCYTEVAKESLMKLAKYLGNDVKVSIGSEDNYIEGIIYEGKFIAGYFLDNGYFFPGIFNSSTFIPGYYNLENGNFIHGLLLAEGFTPGIIKENEFISGIFHEKIFLEGTFELDDRGFLIFQEGDFRDAIGLVGDNSFGLTRDDMIQLGKINIKDRMVGQGSLFLSWKGAGQMWDQGQAYTKEAVWLATPLLLVSEVGVPVIMGLKLGGWFGSALAIGIVYTYDLVTGNDSDAVDTKKDESKKPESVKPKEETPEKKKEEKKKKEEEKSSDDNSKKKPKKDDKGCQTPETEDTDSGFIPGNRSATPIKYETGDIDYLEENNQTTSGTGSGTVKNERGDIDYSKEDAPNDNPIEGKGTGLKIDFETGDIDWGFDKLRNPLKSNLKKVK